MRLRSGVRWGMGLMRILHAACGTTSYRGYGELIGGMRVSCGTK